MAKAVDAELKKAFEELQQKMIETSQKIKLGEIQVETLKKTVAHNQITDRQVKELEPSTRTYEGIGRMFLLKDVADIRQNLVKKITTSEEKIKALEANKQYLERSLKDSENNLREMIQSRKGTVSS